MSLNMATLPTTGATVNIISWVDIYFYLFIIIIILKQEPCVEDSVDQEKLPLLSGKRTGVCGELIKNRKDGGKGRKKKGKYKVNM